MATLSAKRPTGGFRSSPNQGRIFVALKPGHKRSLFVIQDSVRAELKKISGVRPTIQGQR